MAKKIAVDSLAEEIQKILKDFEGVTGEACESGVLETAKEAVKELRVANPQGSGDWSKYNSGWKIKATKRVNGTEAIIHNPTDYRLTHLLEYGHAIVRGGRKIGEARAFEHIKPVEEKAKENLVKNIKKKVENG